VCHISDKLCDSTYFMVLVYVLSEIMMGYKISYKKMLPSEKNLAHSLLCFIDQTHDSWLLQL
jgi:hypothetical protein